MQVWPWRLTLLSWAHAAATQAVGPPIVVSAIAPPTRSATAVEGPSATDRSVSEVKLVARPHRPEWVRYDFLVELLPIGDDNATVPIAAAILSMALLPL